MTVFRFGYGLNGFTGHRLADALWVLADLGYDGVALTLDHAHLDPFGPDLPARTREVSRLLARHRLAAVVETGGRYVLDPWRKHEPTLVSDSGRERRTSLLLQAVRMASDLGAEAVSFWSGALRDGVSQHSAWERLVTAVSPVIDAAHREGVVLAMEPEPGMFIDTVEGVLETRRRLGDPEPLHVTIDVGHLVCNEARPPHECITAVGALLGNVQIEDMRRGVHEHLPFGEGDVDVPGALAAIADTGYGGLISVELPRHSHAAPELARQSWAYLQAAAQRSRAVVMEGRP